MELTKIIIQLYQYCHIQKIIERKMCVCVGVEAQERHTESLPSSTQSHQPMPEMQTMKVEPCINAEKYEGKGGKNGL